MLFKKNQRAKKHIADRRRKANNSTNNKTVLLGNPYLYRIYYKGRISGGSEDCLIFFDD